MTGHCHESCVEPIRARLLLSDPGQGLRHMQQSTKSRTVRLQSGVSDRPYATNHSRACPILYAGSGSCRTTANFSNA
jgi:hypothetical protein